jgi:leucyl-tRNA synthetase
MIWKKLGKEGLAVKASWPVADAEDKILTRKAEFLRTSLKSMRGTIGKAKKGWEKASILVTDSYPEWKVELLTWMQSKYDKSSCSFPATFMKDLKTWSGANVKDKKNVKNAMQFGAFVQKEVGDVGAMAMDVHLPFDQKEVLNEIGLYIVESLGLPTLDVINLATDAAATDVPDSRKDMPAPGKPYVWIH